MEPRLTGIEENEVLLYLGYKGGEIPADIMEEIHRCMDVMMKAARPRAVWRQFALLPDGALKGTDFFPQGKDIRALLQDCDQVILGHRGGGAASPGTGSEYDRRGDSGLLRQQCH